MKIRCYTVTDDRKVVNKTISLTYTELTISNTSSIDIMNPRIVVEYTGTQFSFNYMYCDATGYYYYIDDATMLTGGRVALTCSIDARKSLASFIKNSMPCTITRNGTAPTYIHDSKLPIQPDNCRKEWTALNSPFTVTPDSYRIVCGIFNSRS